MIYKVVVRKDGEGYSACCVDIPSMWSRGNSIEEAIGNFRKEYGVLIEAGLNCEFTVEIK